MKQPAPSELVSLVGDRHTVKLASLERRSGLKELRSMRKSSFARYSGGRGNTRGQSKRIYSVGVGYSPLQEQRFLFVALSADRTHNGIFFYQYDGRGRKEGLIYSSPMLFTIAGLFPHHPNLFTSVYVQNQRSTSCKERYRKALGSSRHRRCGK